MSRESFQYTLHTLRNGLRVVLLPRAQMRTAAVVIMTGTGSRYETAQENGLAHFLEHMFFKGTRRRPNPRDISATLDAFGGVYNAYTAKDRTAYYAKVAAPHIMTTLDILSDLFRHALLRSADIAVERAAILQEIAMYRDRPSQEAYRLFDTVMYGARHPLGRAVLGTMRNVQRFTRRDLRAYHARCYVPRNTVVAVAGGFAPSRVLTAIRAAFGDWSDAPPPRCEAARLSAARLHCQQRESAQTNIVWGVPAPHRFHRDRYALQLLVTVLGGGMSSRLFTEIREKRGLAYSIHAGATAYADTGELYIAAGVAPQRLRTVLRLIHAECQKLCERRVSARELQRAKDSIKSHTVLGLETADDLAQYAAAQLVLRDAITDPHEFAARIDAVSAAQIKRLAQDLFAQEWRLAVVGPHSRTDVAELVQKTVA